MGGAAPARASATVQTYVSRLRRALDDERGALLREGTGYRLVAQGSDARELARATADAEAALAAGDLAGAADRARAGLALWRGEPYADLAGLPDVEPERARLRELREAAAEVLLRTRVQAGAADVVSELEAAVGSAPYREGRYELLVLALYRSARQAEALEALRRVRALLADELGVDPGPRLQELEQRVLAQDPGLLLVRQRAASPTSPTLPVRPERPLSTLHGRDAELAQLRWMLARDRLVTLVGPGGAGKTRLAVEVAEVVGADAGLPVWLVRLADVADPGLVPATVARAVGLVAPGADPMAAVADALAGSGGLLVLDNAEHLLAAAGDLAELLAAGLGGLPPVTRPSLTPTGRCRTPSPGASPCWVRRTGGSCCGSGRSRAASTSTPRDASPGALRRRCRPCPRWSAARSWRPTSPRPRPATGCGRR